MKIVIAGGGIIGLSSAMLLARDGHEVVVIERDPAPPGDPTAAWDDWEHRGVTQVRMAHHFAPRFRVLVERELPDVLDGLVAAGAHRYNPLDYLSADVRGADRPGDEAFDTVTARRVVTESVVDAAASDTAGVQVRRGQAVAGLVAGPLDGTGVPSVAGVRLASGEVLACDLVVDAGGRRSALPTWLDDLGAAPCLDVVEDSGFTYYGRHFHSTDGTQPEQQGVTLLNEFGSVSLLTLPCDNSTWSVVLVAAAGDAPLRGLSRTDRWTEAVRSMPGFEQWVDGEPLEDRVMAMVGIEDRIRSLVVDGRPVASGVLTVGDSWACTNPSVGRGVSIGLLHAVALRDTLHGRSDPADADLTREWGEVTDRVVGPWFEATRAGDRLRLAEMQALAAGGEFTSDDPAFEIARGLGAAATVDPGCVRALFGIAGVLELPGDALAAPGVFDTVLSVGADWRDLARPGPGQRRARRRGGRLIHPRRSRPRRLPYRTRHPKQHPMHHCSPFRHRTRRRTDREEAHGDRQRRREHPRGGGRRGPARPPPPRVPRLGRPVAPPGPGPRRRRLPGGRAGPARLRRLGRAGRRRGVLDPVRRRRPRGRARPPRASGGPTWSATTSGPPPPGPWRRSFPTGSTTSSPCRSARPRPSVRWASPQLEKSWYMFFFQFPGVAEQWLAADGWANFRAWSHHPDADAVVARWEATGTLTAALNWYRANIPPEGFVSPDLELPPVQAPTMGVWSSGDFALTEEQMTGSERYVSGPWRYERVEGPGHWMQLEAPDVVNRAAPRLPAGVTA